MRTRRPFVPLIATLLVASSASTALAGDRSTTHPSGTDVSDTAFGRQLREQAAGRFAGYGNATDPNALAVVEFSDGSIIVFPDILQLTDTRSTSDGFRLAVDANPSKDPVGATGAAPFGALGSPYWSQTNNGCYTLWRGASWMDTCFSIYWMADDGDGNLNFWRLDMTATMFANGRTLDWGWLAADQDAGPQMSWAGANSWSPAQDVNQGCFNYSLSITVLGFGAGFGLPFCEHWDISKSAGSTLGFFKNEWNWGSLGWISDVDRSVGLLIGTQSSQAGGSPTFGLSWDFAAH